MTNWSLLHPHSRDPGLWEKTGFLLRKTLSSVNYDFFRFQTDYFLFTHLVTSCVCHTEMEIWTLWLGWPCFCKENYFIVNRSAKTSLQIVLPYCKFFCNIDVLFSKRFQQHCHMTAHRWTFIYLYNRRNDADWSFLWVGKKSLSFQKPGAPV